VKETNWARFEVECLIARDGPTMTEFAQPQKRHSRPGPSTPIGSAFRRSSWRCSMNGRRRAALTFEDFASRFPVAVMFGLIGVPLARIPEVKDWLEIVGQSFSLDRRIFPKIRQGL